LLRNLQRLQREDSLSAPDRLLLAVTHYRVSLIENANGQFEAAAASLDDAVVLLKTLSTQPELSISDEVQVTLRFVIFTPPITGATNIPGQVRAMRAVCEHGCQIAIPPCGHSSPHC
jgi:hypothetical protein